MAIVRDSEENRMRLEMEWASMPSLRNAEGWEGRASEVPVEPPSCWTTWDGGFSTVPGVENLGLELDSALTLVSSSIKRRRLV